MPTPIAWAYLAEDRARWLCPPGHECDDVCGVRVGGVRVGGVRVGGVRVGGVRVGRAVFTVL